MEENKYFRFSPHLVIGIAIVILGVILTLDNMEFLEARKILHYWPGVLVILGAFMILGTRDLQGRVSGALIAAWGGLLLATRMGYLDFHIKNFWPLILILVGVNMALQAMRSKPHASFNERTITGFAILGGFKRSSNSQEFKGGEMTAFMGGGELDLRQAAIKEGEEAVLSVYAVMGGFKLMVPAGWTVICKVLPLMSGVWEDKTLPQQTGKNQTLIIQGYAIMGGVEIHN
jgi:predicted membrane protein